MPRLVNEARDYIHQPYAVRALDKALAKIGKTRDDVRWLIAVKDDGRFFPVVMFNDRQPELITLAHLGIAVVN